MRALHTALSGLAFEASGEALGGREGGESLEVELSDQKSPSTGRPAEAAPLTAGCGVRLWCVSRAMQAELARFSGSHAVLLLMSQLNSCGMLRTRRSTVGQLA